MLNLNFDTFVGRDKEIVCCANLSFLSTKVSPLVSFPCVVCCAYAPALILTVTL
jgi:hypothetical protein